jgi:cyclase
MQLLGWIHGGGVTTIEQAKKIISLGTKKVAISTAEIKNPSLLKEIGQAVGIQSVVVVIDVKKKGILSGGGYDIYINNAKEKVNIKLKDFILELNEIGVGEIVINSIEKDGTMLGYDIGLVGLVRNLTEVPITVLGGASSYEDIKNLISRFKIIGAAVGSLFVFKGKYRAVLISYPNKSEKKVLF